MMLLLLLLHLYNSLWVLACSIISFHFFLSCSVYFQLFIPIFLKSFLTMMLLISGKLVDKDSLLSLAQAVYSPYVAHVSKYAQYQQAYLLRQLMALQCSKPDTMDTVQSLGQSIPRVISMALEANKTCLLFTEGCGYCGLVKALKVSKHWTCDCVYFERICASDMPDVLWLEALASWSFHGFILALAGCVG